VCVGVIFTAGFCYVGWGDDGGKVVNDINAKVAELVIGRANLADLIRIFGDPEKYVWGGKTFEKDNLPPIYIANYPNNLQVVMVEGKVSEIRFNEPGYLFLGKVQVGSSLDEVLEVIGEPKQVVEGVQNEFKDGVLYKDIKGKNGQCYYGISDKGVRIFFSDNKVSGLYITGSKYGQSSSNSTPQVVQSINSVKEFNDVRNKDLSKLDLSGMGSLVASLTYNRKTVWPTAEKMPAGMDPEKILTEAMNPGLGVRRLHELGITGKGVNVGIIDQPLYLDHPEYAGKIAAYFDTGCESETSMHGPAVTSLLVGTNCGTAPDARVYYAAVPSWKKDSAYYAKSLDWIVEQNAKLPASEKIRVVSVSAIPSGADSPFEKNQEMWEKACVRAEAVGIMVIDCYDGGRGFVGKCWYNAKVPDSVARCNPGDPRYVYRGNLDKLLVPAAPRTTAEQQSKDEKSYQYCGTGGLSWTIPYCAGVLAMGWQVNPELSAEQMKELLFESAYIKSNEAKIIDPRKFISLVKMTKKTGK